MKRNSQRNILKKMHDVILIVVTALAVMVMCLTWIYGRMTNTYELWESFIIAVCGAWICLILIANTEV